MHAEVSDHILRGGVFNNVIESRVREPVEGGQPQGCDLTWFGEFLWDGLGQRAEVTVRPCVLAFQFVRCVQLADLSSVTVCDTLSCAFGSSKNIATTIWHGGGAMTSADVSNAIVSVIDRFAPTWRKIHELHPRTSVLFCTASFYNSSVKNTLLQDAPRNSQSIAIFTLQNTVFLAV